MKPIIYCLFSAAILFATPSFVRPPTLTPPSGSGSWTVDFELSEGADVEVAILNMTDSSIVRRLAAGLLGSNAPAPLASNTLRQTLSWDGTDDLGKPVTGDNSQYKVRVRAGLSFALDKLVGNNPYYFSSVNGAALSDDGSVYVYGIYGSYGVSMTIRKYDAEGNYVKTVFPYPAGVDTGNVRGWGLCMRNDGTYAPSYSTLNALLMSGSMVSGRATKIMPFTQDNKAICYSIVSHWPNPNKMEMVRIGENSSIERNGGQLVLINTPATLPNGGPMLFTKSKEQGYIYLTGAYYAKDLTNYNYTLADTGFWQDGRIYKINLATGIAEVWMTVLPHDSIPDFGTSRYQWVGPFYNGNGTTKLDFAAIHGIAFDDSGHVLVCDRVNKRVSVYDTATKALVGSIPSTYPHQVLVNKSGEVYVLSRQVTGYNTGLVSLNKYSSWHNTTPVASMVNFIPTITHYSTAVRMVLSEGGSKPVIWLTEKTVWAIRDDGTNFTVIKKFEDLCKDEVSGKAPRLFERMTVNPKTEELFFTDAWSGFYKIGNWFTGAAVKCSTSAKKNLDAAEPAISPDGYLYVREGNSFSGPVTRYAMGGQYLTPAPFATRGTNIVDSNAYGRYGIAWGDKGLAVSRAGKVAIIDMRGFAEYQCKLLDTTGPTQVNQYPIYPLAGGSAGLQGAGNCGGVKFDRAGNIYVGALIRSSEHVIPAGFVGDYRYSRGVGAVVKFPPTGGSVGTAAATGALKVYSQGFSAFSGTDANCQCRTPRFDLDMYDRLFIPNALTSEVTVADNNGNTIATLGRYGNVDDAGRDGKIPLATPLTVAVSDNFLYVGDINNARLARIKMNYALDNVPGIGSTLSEKEALRNKPAVVAMSHSPNPFNPMSKISVALPKAGHVELAVYDASGRHIKTIVNNTLSSGVNIFTWDATNSKGQKTAAGVYTYRLTAEGKSLYKRVIYVR
ncbi:MAG: T9SS type A sorting domain-containing protein [Fibrobacteres bacterium]|nr:T9SS type A sorting domain-containing protein [Fibrobacterota bacterium]